jgi:hypothetical protein
METIASISGTRPANDGAEDEQQDHERDRSAEEELTLLQVL